MSCRMKFKLIPLTQHENSVSDIILCEKCHNHFITDNLKVVKDAKNYLHIAICKKLCDGNIQNVHDKVIWIFMPNQWKSW
jgi:hypothetical protein